MAALFISGKRALHRLLVTRSHTLMAKKKTDPGSLKSHADSVALSTCTRVFLGSYMQTIDALCCYMQELKMLTTTIDVSFCFYNLQMEHCQLTCCSEIRLLREMRVFY